MFIKGGLKVNTTIICMLRHRAWDCKREVAGINLLEILQTIAEERKNVI